MIFQTIFRQALKILQSLEGTGGLQWNNLWTRIEPDDPQTMGLYWLMFLVDITIYALIMWYVDTIKPGTYGVGRKWYFPFEVIFDFLGDKLKELMSMWIKHLSSCLFI